MKAAGPALALAIMIPGFAAAEDQAEVRERIFEITPFAGMFLPDDNIRYPDPSGMIGVRAALNNSSYWGIEGLLALAPGQTQRESRGMLNSYSAHPVFDAGGSPTGAFVITQLDVEERTVDSSANLMMFGGSTVINFSKKKFRPFIAVGGGFIEDISNTDESPRSPFSNLFADAGVGFKFYRKSGFALRIEAHDFVMRRDDLPRENERAPLLAALRDLNGGGADGVRGQEPFDPFEYRGQRWLHNLAVTVSASFPLGHAWKDGDGDLIEDRFDDCLTSVPGSIVDEVGCGIDSDKDGVFDGIDECPGTPTGATVNLVGCENDTDGDKVLDGIDVANDTPMGALVDAKGQHFDTDQDGIWDGLDGCNDTPRGATIDDKGCAEDPLEERLLRGERILLGNVDFEPGTAELEPLSFHYVNKVSRLLERWTGHETQPLRVEIGVYTDAIGSEQHGRELSQRRADAIRVYMMEKFSKMGAHNLVAVGYGKSTADAGRRVEIRSLGPGEAAPSELGSGDLGGVENP